MATISNEKKILRSLNTGQEATFPVELTTKLRFICMALNKEVRIEKKLDKQIIPFSVMAKGEYVTVKKNH